MVRLGDSSPGGRARLDALARLLQDVSRRRRTRRRLRRLHLGGAPHGPAVHRFPVYLEPLATAPRGAPGSVPRGPSGASRCAATDGGHVESSTLWVHLDGTTMRPARMPREFLDVFGPSAAGRTVSSKPIAARRARRSAAGAPWPLRFTDFDVLEHVNNAVYLAPVEQALAERRHAARTADGGGRARRPHRARRRR